jgi:hypothetical protein
MAASAHFGYRYGESDIAEPGMSRSAVTKQGRAHGAAFGVGTIVGTLGGLIGLGGAEFRLPFLIGAFRFPALEAVIINKAISLVVVAAALPSRAAAVPFDAMAAHWTVVANLLAGSLTWGLGCQDAQSSMVIISWWCGGGPEVKGAAASAGLRSGTLELGDGSARHWCLACAAVPAGQALSGKLTTSDPRGSSPSRPTAASAAQPHIRPGSFGP